MRELLEIIRSAQGKSWMRGCAPSMDDDTLPLMRIILAKRAQIEDFIRWYSGLPLRQRVFVIARVSKAAACVAGYKDRV